MASPRDYMMGVLRIPATVVDAILEEGGIITFQDFVTVEDAQILDIIKNCRKLPVAAPRARPPRELRNLRDRGEDDEEEDEDAGAGRRLRVSDLASTRVRQLAFFCYHMDRIGREFVPANAVLTRLQRLWTWKKIQTDSEKLEVAEPEPMIKESATRKSLDELDHYLLNKRGVNGTPLAYLTREHVVPAEDPGFNRPSITDELIQRAQHGDYSAYDVDNKYLWGVIRKMTQGGFAWNWVSNLSRSRDGRQAYLQLKSHYLGPSFRNKIKSDADRVLDTAYYDGSRNFTLEEYCGKLKKAFADLEECGEDTSEDRKLRTFMKGLRSPDLMAAKNQILATDTLKTLDAAMNYAKTVENSLESMKGNSRTRNVSSVQSNGGGKSRRRNPKKSGKGRKSNPKTDYIPKEKWLKLSPEQQQAMRDAREKAGIGGKRKTAVVSSDEERDNKKARIEEEQPKEPTGLGDSMSRR